MRTQPTWTDDKGREYTTEPCTRCGGTGQYRWGTSRGLASGTCFLCGGTGRGQARRTDAAGVAQRERARERAATKRQRLAEQRERETREAHAAWMAQHGPLAERLAQHARAERPHPILADLASRAAFRPLSDAQVALAAKLLDEQAAREQQRAQAATWEAGRQVVEGVILASKWVEGFGRGSSDVNKLTVQTDDGRRLYVSAPSPIWVSRNEPRFWDHARGQCAIGDRVRMTVAVQPSADDPTFAFGSRPTKGEIVNPKNERYPA